MKITIVTVTYNSQDTLRDTINSVFNQTYKDIEYWIIDGGSTDGTLDIVHSYEPMFKGRLHLLSEPDNGIYDAMNKGIMRATGDVVGMINSDDMLASEDVLETIAAKFQKHNVDCTFGNLLMVDATKTDKIFRIWQGRQYPKNGFQKGWHPAHPTFYCKKECYDRLGLYDTSFKIAADFELMLRFIERNRISTYFINEYIVKMRMGGASTGSIHNILLGRKEMLRAFKKNGYEVNSLGYYARRIIPKILNIFMTKVHNLYE